MLTTLPIWDLQAAMTEAWCGHNRLVLVAPTGSGKTTQVCQMLWQDWQARGRAKKIVILQPRRVAARSVARRVAEEMSSELGQLVGYQVRFDDRIGDSTQIAFVTEGILLRWLQDDPDLSEVGAVLFDEFHERSLMSDIALALCKQIQQRSRPDLLLLVMSATLDARAVAGYLANGNAGSVPVLESQGRFFPVQVHYQSWGDDSDVWERAAQKVQEIVSGDSGEGDILVFMPGKYEIERTIEELRRSKLRQQMALLPLHGELPPREQDRVFAPSEYRRVIVATNVAETSLTIPGIRYVVDSGLARIDRYDPQRGVNTLHIEPISQASAEQRAGRAGRTAPGVCYRLWSEAQQDQRPIKNTPEVQRTELSDTVLLLHSLGIDDPVEFDFLDKPAAERIRHAELLLAMLGALEPHASGRPLRYQITPLGRQMLKIPAHPRYARMLIEAQRFGCVSQVALMAALVSGRGLLLRLNREDKAMQRNRASLIKRGQTDSDYFLLANAFAYAAQNNFDGRTCHAYGINAHVAREVAMTYQQLLQIAAENGQPGTQDEGRDMKEGEAAPEVATVVAGDPTSFIPHVSHFSETIQRCHLVGFVDQLAVRTSTGSDEFELMGERRATLMEESVVGRNMLIVVSEIREITTRNNGKLTLIGFGSAVKADWVRELNPPSYVEEVRHVYDRLNKRVQAGRVMCYGDLLIGGAPLAENEIDLREAARVLADEFADQPAKLPMWNTQVRQLLSQSRFSRSEIVEALQEAWYGATSYEQIKQKLLLPTFQTLLHNSARGGE